MLGIKKWTWWHMLLDFTFSIVVKQQWKKDLKQEIEVMTIWKHFKLDTQIMLRILNHFVMCSRKFKN